MKTKQEREMAVVKSEMEVLKAQVNYISFVFSHDNLLTYIDIALLHLEY